MTTGLRIVALGGGHGLTASLRAARLLDAKVTALVNVSDDGGSSGRLREDFGIAPPGDLRRCISALVPEDNSLESLLEYRFHAGELSDHALGNLFFVAAQELFGSATAASIAMAEIFGARGVVLPVSEEALTLNAQLVDGSTVCGQVDVHHSRNIASVWTTPEDPAVPECVLDAIALADMVLLGPGSLFTSVLAAVVPKSIARALSEAKATKVYVANLREQQEESVGLTVADCVDALERHGIHPEVVIADDSGIALGRCDPTKRWIVGPLSVKGLGIHDASLLADAISQARPIQ
ncbi:MAG: gluconeogenesis factor YvcK family protein [Acidimicrobiales bacterium]